MNATPNDISMITVLPGTITLDREAASAWLKNKKVARKRWRHMLPLIECVQDYACSLMWVFQGRHEHVVPTDAPWIVILGDDTIAAIGPDGFHGPSLDELIAAAARVVLISAFPEQNFYNAAATYAAYYRQNVILIETLPEQQDAWRDKLQSVKSEIPILFCMVIPEGAPDVPASKEHAE